MLDLTNLMEEKQGIFGSEEKEASCFSFFEVLDMGVYGERMLGQETRFFSPKTWKIAQWGKPHLR